MITIFINFQPLMECYVNLREKGTAINIHLTETWWRHYQVSLSDDEYYQSSLYRVSISCFLGSPYFACIFIYTPWVGKAL